MAACQNFGKRHILSLWLFSALVTAFILRVSINIAIVSMVNNTNTELETNGSIAGSGEVCPVAPETVNNTTSLRQGEFNWDHATQGIILSSFYYGYICSQLLAGYLVRIVGARILIAVAIGGTSALTLLNPIAAQINVAFLIAVRSTEGACAGFTMSSVHYLMGNWAPKEERSLLVAFPFSGQNIGNFIAALLTGVLSEYGGWPTSFYVFGAYGLLWTACWIYVARDSPAKHPTISPEEREYIEKHCESNPHPVTFSNIPWKEMALSPAVWAIIVAHTAYNWNYFTLLTEMSTYLNDVLHIPPAINGLITSIPYLCIWFIQVAAAVFADYLRNRGVTTKVVRKLSYCTGMITSAGCLIGISYVGCGFVVVIVLLCLAVGLSGFGASGYVVNHVDIAPQYASILMGVSNMVATVPGIVSPLLTGALTNEASTISTWRVVFFVAAGISVFGAIFFAVFANGEVQPWAAVVSGDEKKALLTSEENLASDRGNYGSIASKSQQIMEASMSEVLSRSFKNWH